jgi:hypothetical protein
VSFLIPFLFAICINTFSKCYVGMRKGKERKGKERKEKKRTFLQFYCGTILKYFN